MVLQQVAQQLAGMAAAAAAAVRRRLSQAARRASRGEARLSPHSWCGYCSRTRRHTGTVQAQRVAVVVGQPESETGQAGLGHLRLQPQPAEELQEEDLPASATVVAAAAVLELRCGTCC